MQGEGPYRVFLSCKTHAATDVLLKNVLEVQEKLRELRDGSTEAVQPSISTPGSWTCRCTGWPRTTRRPLA